MNRSVRLAFACAFVFTSAPFARGQAAGNAQSGPDSAGDFAQIWRALWQPGFEGGKAFKVSNLELARDRIHLTLTSGQVVFAQPAQGAVYAAVFRGSGRLRVEPPNEIEKRQLRLFTGKDVLDMAFSDAVFSFSDKTYDEIAKQAGEPGAGDSSVAKTYLDRQEERENYGDKIFPRLVKGVLSDNKQETEFFYAEVKTAEKGWVFAQMDALDPKEIEIGRWVSYGPVHLADTWMHFPRGNRPSAEAWKNPVAREDFLPDNYKIFATAAADAHLDARAGVEVRPQWSGERVLQFLLDSNLRLREVKDTASGRALPFVQAQERKDRIQSYGEYVSVLYPEPLTAGKTYALEFSYGGKRVIRSMGPGVFFCQSFGWYPARNNFALRSNFEITFRSPRRYALVATGRKQSDTTDGSDAISVWKSEKPVAVSGFAYGDVKIEKVKAGNVDVEVYANKQPDDQMRNILRITEGGATELSTASSGERERTGFALGTLSPAGMAGRIASDTARSIQLFEAYFGPYPYSRLAVSTIPFSYGQGWPTLLYLSALSFMDSFQRKQFGVSARGEKTITDFFRAHETSHQWWGHKVAWKSYHDQWLSEGFAEFSGNLYLLFNSGEADYLDRLRQSRKAMELKDDKGHIIEQVGPIWMGVRLNSSESTGAYQVLVYGKGGYVLHMLRMMLFDPQNQRHDQRFQAMMRDFTQTYDNQAASTEDFKAIVEKHMTPSMDIESNQRMDWFFRQYVYGTGIPEYRFSYQMQDAGNGQWKITGTVTRSGVQDDWMDILPIYIQRGKGSIRLGFVNALQPQTPIEFMLPFKPDKVSLNNYEDIFAEVKQ